VSGVTRVGYGGGLDLNKKNPQTNILNLIHNNERSCRLGCGYLSLHVHTH